MENKEISEQQKILKHLQNRCEKMSELLLALTEDNNYDETEMNCMLNFICEKNMYDEYCLFREKHNAT